MSRDRRSSSYACAAAVFTLFSVSASWAQTPGPLNAITDVPGIEVGQYTSTDATSGGGTPFSRRPDASFGLAACNAASGGPVQQGNVGAGAGARSGGSKGGLGTASTVLSNGIIVGAIVAVNSSGRTFDTEGNFYAGF